MHCAASAIALAREPATGDGGRWVVAQAEDEIVARYGWLDNGERGLTASMFDPPAGAFVVARRGEAVGPGLGEVRRLPPPCTTPSSCWVDPDERGPGTARRLMGVLEEAARELGLTSLRLAIGERQPEAVALDESNGWDRGAGTAYGFRFTEELVALP